MPSEKTLRLRRGQDVDLLARFAPPRDVTGWSFAFTLREAPAGSVVLTKTSADGIGIDDAGRGHVRVALARADTAALTPTDALTAGKGYVWDMVRADEGSRIVLAAGQLLLEREVSA